MSSLAQLSADDTQRSPLVAQFLAQHGVGSKRAPTIGELRQLRTELGRLSDKAAAWAAQLERGQPLPGPSNSNSSTATATATASGSSGAAGSAAGPGGKRHAAGDDSPETAHSAEGPKPGAIGAESKRAKHSHLASRGGGSDSDGSNNPSSARSSSHGIGGAAANGDGSGASQKDSAGMPVAASAKAKHSAGAPVQDDFSRVKVTNQVQIQTYWAAMEPYFRHVTDEDIVFLESAADNQEDYTIPKLGKFYAHQWAEEEVAHFPDHLHNSKTRYIAQSLLAPDAHAKAPYAAVASGNDLVDSDMSLNTARMAPLTERIVSALVAERLVHQDSGQTTRSNSGSDAAGDRLVRGSSGYGSDSEGSDAELGPRLAPASSEMLSLEDRLKRELRYIGILDEDEDDVNWDDREDDEVCVTMRALQRQLREQVRVNRVRKERLLPIAKEHSGFQEYTQVVDELDKQVEQSYLKRHRQTKSRKRKAAPAKTVSLSDNALNALGRRRRVIQAIGHLFPTPKFALLSTTIYDGVPPNPDIHIE